MHVLFVKSGCHWGIIVARLLNGRKREGFRDIISRSFILSL